MKKYLKLLGLLVLVIAMLAACGDESSDGSNASTDEEKPLIKVGSKNWFFVKWCW